MERPEAVLFMLLWMSVPLVTGVVSHYYLFLRQDLSLKQTLWFGLGGLVAGGLLCFVPVVKVIAPLVSAAPGLLYVQARQRAWIAADHVYLQRKLSEVERELKRAPRSNLWHCDAAKLCAELGESARALYHASLAVEVARGETENSRSHACMYGVIQRAQRQGRVRCEVCREHLPLGTRYCPHCHTDRGAILQAGDVAVFGIVELYAQHGAR